GRDPFPKEIRFTTFTLKYNTMHWVTVEALGEHWERAKVHAVAATGNVSKRGIFLETANVRALTLHIPAEQAEGLRSISIDGEAAAEVGCAECAGGGEGVHVGAICAGADLSEPAESEEVCGD